jgi:hypothetical protein
MRIVLVALLAIVPGMAQADWVKVAETRDSIHYVDSATIRADGNLRQVWELQDFADKRSNGARSRRALIEYDCSAERRRALSIADHPEPMGGGTAFDTWTGQSDWNYLAARTGTNIPASAANRAIRRFVCSQ